MPPREDGPLPEYVSLERAAELLGLAKGTLYNRLCDGTASALDAAKVFGRWRIPMAAIRKIYAAGHEEARGLKRPHVIRGIRGGRRG